MMRRPRKIVAGTLVVLGIVLMVLGPETGGGAVLIALGVIIEVVGIVLENRFVDTDEQFELKP